MDKQIAAFRFSLAHTSRKAGWRRHLQRERLLISELVIYCFLLRASSTLPAYPGHNTDNTILCLPTADSKWGQQMDFLQDCDHPSREWSVLGAIPWLPAYETSAFGLLLKLRWRFGRSRVINKTRNNTLRLQWWQSRIRGLSSAASFDIWHLTRDIGGACQYIGRCTKSV